MLRAILTKPDTIRLEETDIPEPRRGEVRVRLTMTGICGSDVYLFHKGRPEDSPLTNGHEGIGFIEKAGEGVNVSRTGERVVIEPNIPCHNCPECRSGRGNVCRNKRIIGVTENGCFAEYVVLPEAFTHKLPTNITDQDAVTIEPATVALSALLRSEAKPGDTILVIGLGAIGLLVTHIAMSLGYRVFVTDPVRLKVESAVKQGAVPVNAGSDYKENIKNLQCICQNEDVKSVFECAGSEKSASLAIAMAPPGTEVVLLGLSAEPASFIPIDTSKKGIRIIFSLIYNHPVDYKRTIQLISSDKIHPGFIVTRYFHLKEIQKAMETASAGKESKIVIKIR